MKNLQSFRELLTRKMEDSNLISLIKSIKDNSLADMIIESLEKMSMKSSEAQSVPNASLAHFIKDMKHTKPDSETESPMAHHIRDAMGHHASAYKTAIENNDQNTANKHAEKFIQYGHLAGKIHRAPAKDVLDFDAVSLTPWQKNHDKFRAGKNEKSKKDWNALGWKNYGKDRKDGDYSYLRQAPSIEASKDVFSEPHSRDENGNANYHNGPYPMEHVKINGKYIPITEGAKGDHPMDNHPIMDVFHHSPTDHTTQVADRYQVDKVNFKDSEHHRKLMDNHEKSDEEAGKEIGSKVHDRYDDPILLHPNDRVQPRTLQQQMEDHDKETAEAGTDAKAEAEQSSYAPQVRTLQQQMEDADREAEAQKAPVANKVRTKKDVEKEMYGINYDDPDSAARLKALVEEHKTAK